MQVTVRGWSRDHGKKPVLEAELNTDDVIEGPIESFSRGKTYFQVNRSVRQLTRGRRKVDYRIKVSSHAELNLSGSYLVQLDLSRNEIARLFYLTNGDRSLPELLQFFSKLKKTEDVGMEIESDQ